MEAALKTGGQMMAKRIYTRFLLVGMALLGSEVCLAQTDVAASLYWAFGTTTTGNRVMQGQFRAPGALFEVRHISNPIVGFEGTYSFNRANQSYFENYICPGINCGPTVAPAVSANAHELTGDWVASLKIRNLRPFALVGGGVILDMPRSPETVVTIEGGLGPIVTASTTTNTIKPVFVYGGGLDWGLLPHLGLRFQFRGNLNKAPALATFFPSTNALTHTAEPTIGAYFRF
jgi:hypothetical protein